MPWPISPRGELWLACRAGVSAAFRTYSPHTHLAFLIVLFPASTCHFHPIHSIEADYTMTSFSRLQLAAALIGE